MRAFKIIEIIFASIIATLILAAGAQAAELRELAGFVEPSAQPIMLAQANQHFSGYEARLADREQGLQGAQAADRAPTVSWYERKTGRGAASSDTAAESVATPFTGFHDRAPKNCTASLATLRQRPWCS